MDIFTRAVNVSDDENDMQPKDTPSLFKLRHEARVQTMEEVKGKTGAALLMPRRRGLKPS